MKKILTSEDILKMTKEEFINFKNKIGIDCSDCFNCSNCSNCSDCFYCSHCYGCWGIKDKKYMILNVQLTRKEYEGKLNEFNK